MKKSKPFRKFVFAVLCILIFVFTFDYPVKTSSVGIREKPSVVLRTSKSEVFLPCPPNTRSTNQCCGEDGLSISLRTEIKNFKGASNDLNFSYEVTAGRIVGTGFNVTWDLIGATPGTYSVAVTVTDPKRKKSARDTITVSVKECPACAPPAFACPVVKVTCLPNSISQGGRAFALVETRGEDFQLSYTWTLSNGAISNGQGSPTIEIDTNRQSGTTITTTIQLEGLPGFCTFPDTCQIQVR